MDFSKTFIRLILALLVRAHFVLAGPGGYISLINATPYEWSLTYQHQYQMDWQPSKTVAPGTSKQDYFEFKRNHKDEAAEAVYTLVGHPTNASFTLQARNPRNVQRLEVQYNDGLYSLNNPENSLINLYFSHDGGISFVLSGDGIDVPFISSNPPIAWMQATLPTIGSKLMRETSMPASHDAGLSKVTISYGGIAHNTVTQSGNIYKQLVNGARYFDIRPVLSLQKWYTNHITWGVGGFGQTIKDIVRDINQFTTAYPGELIIIELSHDMDAERRWKPIKPEQWQDLYSAFLAIKDIWLTPNDLPEDITIIPISTFIQPGSKSAVIIRIPNGAPLPQTGIKSRDLGLEEIELTEGVNNSTGRYDLGVSEDVNGDQKAPAVVAAITALSDVPHVLPTDLPEPPAVPEPTPVSSPAAPVATALGFFHERRIPQTGSYSNSKDGNYVSRNQIAKLKQLRPSRDAEPLRSTWTITQSIAHAIDIATRGHSVLKEAAWAHKTLFRDLWGNMSPETYPNLIEIDDVWNSQVAALCMAINDHFATASVVEREERGKAGRFQRRERRISEV